MKNNYINRFYNSYRGRKSTHQLAFSLTLDSVEMTPLYFVAPDEMVYDYWVDGINSLLGN